MSGMGSVAFVALPCAYATSDCSMHYLINAAFPLGRVLLVILQEVCRYWVGKLLHGCHVGCIAKLDAVYALRYDKIFQN